MNSSIEIAEAIKLAEKLIARTNEGRLVWKTSGTMAEEGWGAAHFETTLEGNLRASVSEEGDGQRLRFSLLECAPSSESILAGILGGPATVPQDPEKVVIDVSIEKDPSYGFDTPNDKHLAGLLMDLFGLARRSALKITGSVERALTYLDRIAS